MTENLSQTRSDWEERTMKFTVVFNTGPWNRKETLIEKLVNSNQVWVGMSINNRDFKKCIYTNIYDCISIYIHTHTYI
jgi:hypothetical protein